MNPLHQQGEQGIIEAVQPIRPVLYDLHRAVDAFHLLVNFIITEQLSPLPAQFRHFGVQFRLPYGKGLGVQQSGGVQLT